MPSKKILKKVSKLPKKPGIYLFYNKKGKLLYVGKATSIKNRVRSYFSGKRTSRPIEEMIHEVSTIKHKVTDSVLEAIILEANYIKKYQPPYNVMGKDDKSWNYIVITKDEYPRVEMIREHTIKQFGAALLKKKYKYMFGPYPGLNMRATLKLLQRLFYISTCKPTQKRACLYHQMHQCLGVCTGEIRATDYKKKVIRPLIALLRGQKKRLLTGLVKEMKAAAKAEYFEEAARLRNQIYALERIRDVSLINKSFFAELHGSNGTFNPVRIEGYDISNLGASGKVGSMVVFTNGEPEKSQYRKFKIKTVVGQSDVGSLKEVLVRRLRRYGDADLRFARKDPDLFLIDGGLPQVNCAKRVMQAFRLDIPIVGIAKGPARKKNQFILGTRRADVIKWVNAHQDTLIRVRDEAHRFAIKYQKSLRKIKVK